MFVLFYLSLQKRIRLMRLHRIVLLLIFIPFFISCSEPTMEEDARAAADLSRISNQCAAENDMAGAGKAYSEVQAIMEKYKELNKFDEFYDLYGSFLGQSASIEDAKMEKQNAQHEESNNKPAVNNSSIENKNPK